MWWCVLRGGGGGSPFTETVGFNQNVPFWLHHPPHGTAHAAAAPNVALSSPGSAIGCFLVSSELRILRAGGPLQLWEGGPSSRCELDGGGGPANRLEWPDLSFSIGIGSEQIFGIHGGEPDLPKFCVNHFLEQCRTCCDAFGGPSLWSPMREGGGAFQRQAQNAALCRVAMGCRPSPNPSRCLSNGKEYQRSNAGVVNTGDAW